MADVRLRRATEDDLRFLSALASHEAVEQFLMPGSGDLERLGALFELGRDEGGAQGLFVIDADGGQAGGLVLQIVSHHSKICALSGLMVAPELRRAGIGAAAVRLACEHAFGTHGLHRIQAEVYGDNVGSRRLFERVGFTREGVRRRAYWRRGQWLDGVLYGFLADEQLA